MRQLRHQRGERSVDTGGVPGGREPGLHDQRSVWQLCGAEDDRHRRARQSSLSSDEQDQVTRGFTAQVLLWKIYPRQAGELLQIRQGEAAEFLSLKPNKTFNDQFSKLMQIFVFETDLSRS